MYVRKIERRIAQIPYRWETQYVIYNVDAAAAKTKQKNDGICSGVMGFIAMLSFVWAVAVGGENRNIYDFHGDLKMNVWMPLRLGFNCSTTIWQHSLRLEHSLLPLISLDSWHTDENITNNRNYWELLVNIIKSFANGKLSIFATNMMEWDEFQRKDFIIQLKMHEQNHCCDEYLFLDFGLWIKFHLCSDVCIPLDFY